MFKQTILLLLVVALLMPLGVSAQPELGSQGRERAEEAREQARERSESVSQSETGQDRAESAREEGPEQASDRREQAQVRACQNRAEAINRMTDRHVQRIERFNEVFAHFFEQIQIIHDEAELDVDEYDERVAAAEEQDEVITDNLDELRGYAENFNCEDPDPGAHVRDYIELYRATIGELHDYRNLVLDVARDVRSEWNAQSDSEEDEDTEDETDDADDTNEEDADVAS